MDDQYQPQLLPCEVFWDVQEFLRAAYAFGFGRGRQDDNLPGGRDQIYDNILGNHISSIDRSFFHLFFSDSVLSSAGFLAIAFVAICMQ